MISLFAGVTYRLFFRLPSVFFELIGQPDAKQLVDRVDSTGDYLQDTLFIPIVKDERGLKAYFAEVQYHIDDRLFHHFFDGMFRYMRDRSEIERWHAAIVYPTRTIETNYKLAYEVLLSGPQVQRIYLDEFFASSPSSAISIEESLALRILELIIEKEETVLASAKNLIWRVSRELADEDLAWEMLKSIETVVSCKLRLFVKKDLEAMLYTETGVKPPFTLVPWLCQGTSYSGSASS